MVADANDGSDENVHVIIRHLQRVLEDGPGTGMCALVIHRMYRCSRTKPPSKCVVGMLIRDGILRIYIKVPRYTLSQLAILAREPAACTHRLAKCFAHRTPVSSPDKTSYHNAAPFLQRHSKQYGAMQSNYACTSSHRKCQMPARRKGSYRTLCTYCNACNEHNLLITCLPVAQAISTASYKESLMQPRVPKECEFRCC